MGAQVVHFVRHGEGYHNVAGRKSTEEYKKEDYADAHLTELGWTQVSHRHQHEHEHQDSSLFSMLNLSLGPVYADKWQICSCAT